MKYVYKKLKNYKLLILLVVFSTIAYSAFGLAMPYYSKYVVDGIAGRYLTISKVLAIGLAIVTWGAVTRGLKRLSMDNLASRLSCEMRSDYVKSVIYCPVPDIKEMGEGRILTNYSQDINAVMTLIRAGLNMVTIPFEMVTALICLYIYNWRLAMVVTLVFPLVMVSGQVLGKQVQKLSENYLMHDDKAMGLVARIVKGIEVVRVHSYQDVVVDEFNGLIGSQLDLELRRARYSSAFEGITDFFMGLPYVVVFVSAAFLTRGDYITAGTLAAFLQLLNKITTPFATYGRVLMQFKGAKASMNRLNDVIFHDVETCEPIRGFENIVFDDVTFGYAGKDKVLEHCSLNLENGKYYGVIGGNGSGKSTIGKLLMKLYQPTDGIVRYNKDARKNNKIVYIEDKPVVLFDDIIQNIIVNKDLDNDKLDIILCQTELKTKSADYIGGKKANELSAGLLQRMIIARALYQIDQDDILIIDEGFSALDIDMRPKMYQLIKEYQTKYHLIVFDITHNVNEKDRFDKTIVVGDGKAILMEQAL